LKHGPAYERPDEGEWGRRALAVLDAAPDPVVCIDATGRVSCCNGAAAALLGVDSEAAAGMVAADLLAPPEGEQGLGEEIARALADPDAVPRRVERSIAVPGGTRRIEASICSPAFDGACAVTIFLRDVTSRRRSEQLRDVEHRLARVLAAARSGVEIARGSLEMVATGLGFDHAELWLVADDGETLRLSTAWRREPGGPFAESARRLVVRRGDDLAGLAWEIGETVCLDDACAVEGLHRAEAIAEEGIRGCAALPLRAGNTLVGTVVVARRDGDPLDPELRQTLHSIAVQLGHFGERRLAERRLAEETVAIAAVARATRALSASVDATAAGHAICRAAMEISGATYTFLALPDPEHGGLVVRSYLPLASPAPGHDDERRFTTDEPSAVMRAYQTGQAVLVSDTEQDPYADTRRARAAGVASGLLQPILRDDETIGVLGLGWATRQGMLDRSLRMLVRLLANEASMALTRVELVSRLEAAARTDPLTGLANVRAWHEQLERELATAHRHGRPVAIALLDLDGFKDLNDRLGHQSGDRVLRESAAAWQHQLRKGDLLARLGGDEFAALLPGCEPDDAMRLAERLRKVTQHVTASIGVAYWLPEESAGDLMGRADSALYEAKAAGRDRTRSN
jgi:diguanylate cyclase (GGDEF)-like protein/PAS domain S-box-containing protein